MVIFLFCISIYRINDLTKEVVETYDNIPDTEMYIGDIKNINKKIEYYSERYNVSKNVVSTVVSCESKYNPNAVGDGGNSRGLVQIHAPSHPYISNEEAFNPDFALKFLALNLSKGKGGMWSCYRSNFS